MKNISIYKDVSQETAEFLAEVCNNIRNFLNNPDNTQNHVAYFPPIKEDIKPTGYYSICSLIENLN